LYQSKVIVDLMVNAGQRFARTAMSTAGELCAGSNDLWWGSMSSLSHRVYGETAR
jgi:hypothetical protein